MKFCNSCKVLKNEEEFSKRNKNGKEGLQAWCKSCSNKNRTEDYYKNREREVKVRQDRKKNIRVYLEEYKKTLRCEICGENHPATLDFHHKNSEDKDFVLAEAVKNGYSITRINEEIKKCNVLCSNCHRKLHYKK